MARPKEIPFDVARFLRDTPPYVHAAKSIVAGVKGSGSHIRVATGEAVEMGLVGRTSDASNGAGVAYFCIKDPDTNEPLELASLTPAEVAMLKTFRQNMKS